MNIIISRGSAKYPARFWDWAVCSEEEFTDDIKNAGWVKSQCTKYLSNKQIEILSQN